MLETFSGGEADAYPRGKFEHVIEKLDYLVDLGINAIELDAPEGISGGPQLGLQTPAIFFRSRI